MRSLLFVFEANKCHYRKAKKKRKKNRQPVRQAGWKWCQLMTQYVQRIEKKTIRVTITNTRAHGLRFAYESAPMLREWANIRYRQPLPLFYSEPLQLRCGRHTFSRCVRTITHSAHANRRKKKFKIIKIKLNKYIEMDDDGADDRQWWCHGVVYVLFIHVYVHTMLRVIHS